jgi:hypothetical protein
LTSAGDVIVLVNDINVYRQAFFYRIYGREALLKECRRQPKCGVVADLCPRQPEEATSLLDFEEYDLIVNHFNGSTPSFDAFKSTIRSELLPRLISRRLTRHRVPISHVLVFRESQLRNFASARIRGRRAQGPGSWRSCLMAAGLLNYVLAPVSKIPTCAAILLALYEQLIARGYSRIVHLFDVQHRPALENVVTLLRRIREADPNEPRWNLSLEHYYYADGVREIEAR